MKIKPGVDLCGLRPEMTPALLCMDRLYTAADYVLTLTSVVDGRHSEKSLHYRGLAFDCRTTAAGMPQATIDEIVEAARAALPGFDVLDEGDHLHVEWDPVR